VASVDEVGGSTSAGRVSGWASTTTDSSCAGGTSQTTTTAAMFSYDVPMTLHPPSIPRRDAHAASALLIVMAASGCRPLYVDLLRGQASVTHTCPVDRVVVRQLPVPANMCAQRSPPAEVAADAERLALWDNQEHARLIWCRETRDFLVDACGHTSEAHCWVGWGANGRGWGEQCKSKP
jgi:hypothetical protein